MTDTTTCATTAPRMTNPAMVLPGALDAVLALDAAVKAGPLPGSVLDLVHLRASQINGCASCLDAGTRHAQEAGESALRLAAVATWREATCFTERERAALGLAEAVTRLADRHDAVPDDVWERARRAYDEPALAALVLAIATTNVWNRLNVTTRQQPGAW